MANAKIIEAKQHQVEEIAAKVKEASSVVFFDYRGLSVTEMTELRRNLKANGADLKICKNTLAKRALDKLHIDLGDITGPKAIAFGTDAVAPIKILSDFSKTHPALEMKVGIVDGGIADMKLLSELASIPSREGLLTMLAGGLIATIKDLSIALDLYSQTLEN